MKVKLEKTVEIVLKIDVEPVFFPNYIRVFKENNERLEEIFIWLYLKGITPQMQHVSKWTVIFLSTQDLTILGWPIGEVVEEMQLNPPNSPPAALIQMARLALAKRLETLK
jgi:hypothetical protein